MTPEEFIDLWKDNKLTERGGAQAHFDDLCDLLGVDKPRDPDNYCFEHGAKKSGGGDGWADVWKRGCFGWENKKPGRDLAAALHQLTDYTLKLENPPLFVVSDRERIIIHTAFTGYPDEPREIRIEELVDPEKRQILHWVFTDPQKLRPEKSTAAIAEAVADLDTWREKWLNPEGWLDWEITPEEQSAGFPPRPVPKPEYAAAWKKRTLTNLYNEMPAGLKLRQENLDRAVAAAYGWTDYTPDISDGDILHRLLALKPGT
jgi:hypothetical protein